MITRLDSLYKRVIYPFIKSYSQINILDFNNDQYNIADKIGSFLHSNMVG